MHIKTDCRYYLGDRPCKYHKLYLITCPTCNFYQAAPERVLLIKLGPAGNVVRTTPLLFPLWERHPKALIYWLTDYPELAPPSVDRVLTPDCRNQAVLEATPWRAIYNLDKDALACALTSRLTAPDKYGFTLENGVCAPVNEQARDRWLTGLSDTLNRAKTTSYLEDIFHISGFTYQGEPYILEAAPPPLLLTEPDGAALVGLNTGCGGRWPTRRWPDGHWASLIQRLLEAGLRVLLLGGPDEHAANLELARRTGALYPGYFPLKEFVGVVAACDLVVTGVTLALHLALGAGKKVVVLNNIFNRHELELFGQGEILEPDLPCLGCMKSACTLDCMAMIEPERVFDKVLAHLGRKPRSITLPATRRITESSGARLAIR